MEVPFLTRSYLESLSSADLISLADDYDIDIPSDLNRRFIIGELLEAAEELKRSKKNDMVIASETTVPDSGEQLPDTYNETQICVVLRNPVWAFVYWDIREADLHRLKVEKAQTTLMLTVLFFDDSGLGTPVDSFDIQISFTDREQYVLLPTDKKFVQIDLIYLEHNQKRQLLASSRKVELPHGCGALVSARPGKTIVMSRIMKLSGMEVSLRSHYAQHRQSFS